MKELTELHDAVSEQGGFFVKAFQSYLWNVVVAWRMGRFGGRVLAGDLAREGMAGKLEEVV